MSRHLRSIGFLTSFCLLTTFSYAQKTKITLEQIGEKCKDLPRDQRVSVQVARFSTKNPQAQGKFGGELATMFSNALQESNCFRVIEANVNMADGSDVGGDTENAQLIVTGEITEFAEGKSSTSVAFVNVGSNKAKVGFVLKVVNPQNSEILFSKSVNAEAKAGFGGVKLFGVETAGSTVNGPLANAVEQAILQSVEILADQRDKIVIPVAVAPKKFSPANCAMLRNGRGPKIMILIPEAQTVGGPVSNQQYERQRTDKEQEYELRRESIGLLRDVFRSARNNTNQGVQQPQQKTQNATAVNKPVVIENSAAESAIIKRFIEAGFRVIDPKIYDKLRKQSDSLTDDMSRMAAIGLKMGANIIITGFAVSERTANNDGLFAFRGKIELRAITTDDATILASHSQQAGAVDIAESAASKKSLQNASDKMARYMLEQLCARNLSFADTGPATASKTATPTARVTTSAAVPANTNSTEIAVTNATFPKLNALAEALSKNPKVKAVKKAFSGTTGTVSVEHTGNSDELIDVLSKNPAVKFEVTALEDGKAGITLN